MSTMIAVLVGVTILMLGALLAQRLLTRRSAATRALVWQLALTGALAIALLAPWIPTLSVRVPMRVAPDRPSAVRVAPSERTALAPAASVADRSVVPTGASAGAPALSVPVNVITMEDWLRRAAFLWALGAIAVATWWAIGRVLLARLARGARAITDASWSEIIEAERRRSGLVAPVRVLRSSAAGSPLTWGEREIVVLLPEESSEWPAERRRVVLAHELAHAARGDHRAQLIASIACAVHWFHPLVWVAARRLRTESERACDDRVLDHGVAGVDYAAHLLHVARRSRAMRYGGMVAIGMARPGELEGRLLAVLDPERSRGVPGRTTRAVGWTALAAIVLPLAAMRPAPPPAAPPPQVEPSTMAPVVVTPVAKQSVARVAPAAIDSTFERSLPATNGGTLEIDLRDGGGDIRVTAWDEQRVMVRARIAGSDWRDEQVSFEAKGSTISLRSELHATGRHGDVSIDDEFEFKVPRRFNVRVRSAGGSVGVEGLQGDVSGFTGGGQLTLTQMTGRADLTTGGGEVLLENSTLDGRVSTGGGVVHIKNVKGEVKASSGSGEIYREGDAGGSASYTKAGGSIDVEHAGDGTVFHTGGGGIRIGSSEGTIKATTGGGDVHIGPVAGSVMTSTGAGNVEVIITDGSTDVHDVKITTGSGAATLWLPSDIDAEFELETAYTENFHRKTRIESDFPLERSETADWDDSQGSPRKYVRARGTVGSGTHRGRIRIVIVNGDITIKKGAP